MESGLARLAVVSYLDGEHRGAEGSWGGMQKTSPAVVYSGCGPFIQ